MTINDNKATSKRWHEAWGTPDLPAAYRTCLHPKFEAEFFGQGRVDRDAYMRGDTAFLAAFSGTKMVVEEMVAEGDTVVCRMTWRGRHTGDAPGLPATGKPFEIMGFGLDRYEDGLVIEHIALFDQAALRAQLGLG
jgi:predicted ester cyclase